MGSKTSSQPTRCHAKRRAGFTLLEAIVAIVMFTIIIMALSQAFGVALQATERARHRQEADGTVRAIFDVITRDILAAYPSIHSPVAIFSTSGVGGGSARPGSANSSGDILTFSALSTRLQTPELDSQSNSSIQPANSGSDSLPQSDMGVVRYNFDASNGTLYRIVNPFPYPENQSTPAPTQDQAIAQNIQNIQLEFWDQTQGTWRTDWDFEQQNQVGVVPLSEINTSSSSASSSSTSSAGSSGTSSQGTANTTATGDTYLPSAVRITVTMAQRNGQSQDFVTTIPIGSTQAFTDPNQTANVNTNPVTTSSGSTGSTSRTTP